MRQQVFVLTLAAALAATAGPVWAQGQAAPSGGTKVGIINIQRAIAESNEGKKAADKLQTQFTPRRNELQAKQAEIEKLQKQLREQEKTLSDDARNALIRQIETKTKEFNRSNDDATSDLQNAEGQVINEIGQRVMKVLDDYARKNSYHVIMDVSAQGPVLWASSAVDVTDEIIKLFNAAGPASASGSAAPPPAATPAPRPATPAAKPPVTGAPAAKKPGGPQR